jgi:hypothetical protein
MSLSHRERRILAEIEHQCRRDRAFSRRIDALTGEPPRDAQRYACDVSSWELIWVFLTVAFLTALSLVVVLTAGRTCAPVGTPSPPQTHRPHPGGTAPALKPALKPAREPVRNNGC